MKKTKRIIALALTCVMCFGLAACGEKEKTVADSQSQVASVQQEKEAAPASTEAQETVAAETQETVAQATEAQEEVSTEDFTLLDISADMIDAAIYTTNESGCELVLALFTAPDGSGMCAMLEYDNTSETGDVACGVYEAESAEDEEGIAWTYLTFEDVYTGDTLEMGFGEADDGSCALILPTGDVYEAEYLDSDTAIDYMGAAVALMTQ